MLKKPLKYAVTFVVKNTGKYALIANKLLFMGLGQNKEN